MRIALCICPQWSIESPSYALGVLKSEINNPNVEVKQFDINMDSSIYMRDVDYEFWYDWGNDKPWNSDNNFREYVLPRLQDFWKPYIEELSTYDVVTFTNYTSNIMSTDYIARYVKEKNPNVQIWYGGPYSWYSEYGGLVEQGGMQNNVKRIFDINHREFVDVACNSSDGETVIGNLVDCYVRDGHYENVKGIWRWDKMKPSFPTFMKAGRSGRKAVFNGKTIPLNLNNTKTPMWDEDILENYLTLCKIRTEDPKFFTEQAQSFSEEHMLENEDGYDPREMKGAIPGRNRNSMIPEMDKTIAGEKAFAGELSRDGHSNLYSDFAVLPIQGSRGCTFKCTFCAETRLYRYKSPEKIIEQMKHMIDKTGIYKFWFTDSLINGSMKLFSKFIEELECEIKNGRLPDNIEWGGHFRTHKKLDGDLLSRANNAGLNHMNVGFESGVPKILGLMEKGQLPEQISDFLKGCYESKAKFQGNWMPGFPRENHMDFLVGSKWLYDNAKYFRANGEITLLQSTDIYDNTPLDVYKDEFDVSKENSFLNDWVSNDNKNFLLVRHLRSFLYEAQVNIFEIFYRRRIWNNPLKINKLKVDLKDKVDSIPFESEFLNSKNFRNPKKIIENEIILTIKSFVWNVINVSNKVELDIEVKDKFLTYRCKNSFSNIYIKLDSVGDDFDLIIDYDVRIDKEDKNLSNKYTDDLDFIIKDKLVISGNVNDYKSNNKVKELYNDTMDYKKYKINLKRTEMTSQY